MRNDRRALDELRTVNITPRFTGTPAGSVLWQQGRTLVWCTASILTELPPWMPDNRPGGWITADYVMLPASTPRRKAWPSLGHTDSRGTEIQRLIGRCLRAVVDLSKIGPFTIALDCQVMQADGGTRTAAICGAYLALRDALGSLPTQLPPPPAGAMMTRRYDPAFYDPTHALVDELAAVSAGLVDGQACLDLDYSEDCRATVDMNVACTATGRLVEIQASAENGQGFARQQLDQLLDLCARGCARLIEIQRQAYASPPVVV